MKKPNSPSLFSPFFAIFRHCPPPPVSPAMKMSVLALLSFRYSSTDYLISFVYHSIKIFVWLVNSNNKKFYKIEYFDISPSKLDKHLLMNSKLSGFSKLRAPSILGSKRLFKKQHLIRC